MQNDDLVEAAERVVRLYPTIAGTAILIRDANRHVPRNAWDDIADAVHALGQALAYGPGDEMYERNDDDRSVVEGLAPELARVLRDPSIVVSQDAAVFEAVARWQNAPSDTASAGPNPAWLIERGQQENQQPTVWLDRDERFAWYGGWTTDANEARRFATRKVAEDYVREHPEMKPCRVTEHLWGRPE